MEPWKKPMCDNLPPEQHYNRVTVAQLETDKVPEFGELLKVKIREVINGKARVRTGVPNVPLRPTEDNTLLLEAGCASGKTRRLLLTWLKLELQNNPDMPVLFVTTRKTHADDLAETVKALEGMHFTNYLDSKECGSSKQEFVRQKRLIISEQSLGKVDIELYKDGVGIMDEVRSFLCWVVDGVRRWTRTAPGTWTSASSRPSCSGRRLPSTSFGV